MQEVQAGDKATSATRNSGFRMDVTGAIEKEYISFVMSRPPRFVKDTKNGDAWLSLYVVEGDSVA
jgi:hypothetical protein